MTNVYWLLANTPQCVWWVLSLTVLIYVLFIGRERYEGLPYNIAYSSLIGDTFLVAIISIEIDILVQHGFEAVPPWVEYWPFIMGAAGVTLLITSLGVGILWKTQRGEHPFQLMDGYHNVFIMPALTFLLYLSCVPLFWLGKWWQITLGLLFFFGWLGLFWYDVAHDRLDQQKRVAQMAKKFLLSYGYKIQDP